MKRIDEERKREEREKTISELEMLLRPVVEKGGCQFRLAGVWAQEIVDFSDVTPDVESFFEEEGAQVTLAVGEQKIRLQIRTDSCSVESVVLGGGDGAGVEENNFFRVAYSEPVSHIQKVWTIEERTSLYIRGGREDTGFVVVISKLREGTVTIEASSGNKFI